MRGLIGLGMVMLVAGLACSVTGYATAPMDPVRVGTLDDYPPGSMTEIDLHSSFYNPDQKRAVSHVPLILVREDDLNGETLVAYYAREPRSRCPIVPHEAANRLEGWCLGTIYTLDGKCFNGPCLRDIDRFDVIIGDDGTVSVDLQTFQKGEPVFDLEPMW